MAARLNKQEVLARLKASGVVAILRAESPDGLIEVAQALARGGVEFVEITMTVPDALSVISQAVAALGSKVVIGAGTVLDATATRAAIQAGAGYIISPAVRPAVIEVCRQQDIACMPGAMTPTEVLEAWELGGDVIKIFPANVAGPQFFRDLKGPYPQIALMPTGAVNRETAPQYIRAGACAVGVGGELVSKSLLAGRDFDRISQNAADLIQVVKQAREQMRTGT